MNDNKIVITAGLDIQASIAQINKDLKTVQAQLNKLIVSAKLDKETEKNIKNLTQSLTQLQRVTSQLDNKKIDIASKDEGIAKILEMLKEVTASLDEIKEQDSEILEKYNDDYTEYNDKLNQLVNIEIANLNESIKAKDIEIKAKQAQIDTWKKYKNQVISIADSIKSSLSDYSKFLNDVNINENSTYQERLNNLNAFAEKYSDFIAKIADKNLELESATSRVNELSEAMGKIGGIDLTSINDSMEESLSFIEKYADAIKAIQKRLEESSTGYGIVNSAWDEKLIKAASATSINSNISAEKLYSAFKADAPLIDAAKATTSNVSNVSSNINNNSSSNEVNVDVHIGQIVSDNPQQFAKQMEKYLQNTIVESQVFPPRK